MPKTGHRRAIDVGRSLTRAPTPAEFLPDRARATDFDPDLLGGSADAAGRAAADGIKTLRVFYPKEQS